MNLRENQATKKRIVILINSLRGGGAERVAVTLADKLAKQGHEVCIVTHADMSEDFYVVPKNVRRVRLRQKNKLATSVISRLLIHFQAALIFRRFLKKTDTDIVIGMMTWSALIALLAVWGTRTRAVTAERNAPWMESRPRSTQVFTRLLYRRAAAHVAQTSKTAEWLIQTQAANNVRVIPNAVGRSVDAKGPKIAPHSIVPSSAKVLLAVGSKMHQKGFDMLVKAFSALSITGQEWHLVILGLHAQADINSNAKGYLAHLANERHIGHRLHMPGPATNLGDWYKRSDIFALTSRYEGFPNVLLEAMAAGTACIAFDCETGPSDIIEHGINGLLVPRENIRALTETIQLLADDQPLRASLGSASRNIIHKYSWRTILSKWEQLLKEL